MEEKKQRATDNMVKKGPKILSFNQNGRSIISSIHHYIHKAGRKMRGQVLNRIEYERGDKYLEIIHSLVQFQIEKENSITCWNGYINILHTINHPQPSAC